MGPKGQSGHISPLSFRDRGFAFVYRVGYWIQKVVDIHLGSFSLIQNPDSDTKAKSIHL